MTSLVGFGTQTPACKIRRLLDAACRLLRPKRQNVAEERPLNQ